MIDSLRPDDPRPEPPVRPEPDDCCNGGCERCVFDLYEDALEHYRAALEEYSYQESPIDVAITQSNLGQALRDERSLAMQRR